MDDLKYIVIFNDIKEKILNKYYSLGMLLPSEKELQDKYKVSRYTIRCSMDLLTSEGFITKKKGSGSYVSHNFINNNKDSKKKIGLIVTYMSDYIFPSIIRGIETYLKNYGYSLIVSSTNNNHEEEKKCLDMMLNQNISGVIIEPTKSNIYNPNLSYYSLFKQRDIPLLMINATYDELNLPYIAIDDIKSGYLVTKYLLDHGHEKIALISKTDDNQGKLRMKGYFNAFEEAQILFDNKNIYTFNTENKSVVINKITEHILNDEFNFSSIVCYNDEIAYNIIQSLIKRGVRVPEDISVVGQDNSSLSHLSEMNLTTTFHPQEVLGRKAAEKLIYNIKSGVINSSFLDTYIIERGSVKKIYNK